MGMKHVVRCPHCGHEGEYPPSYEAERACSNCGEAFMDLGPLPLPNWSITVEGEPGPDAGSLQEHVPHMVCPYCGSGLGRRQVCRRCGCDLKKCAPIVFPPLLSQLDDSRRRAFLALAGHPMDMEMALMRLHRLDSRRIRQMGGSVELADAMMPIPEPPRILEDPEKIKRRLETQLADDDSWEDEAFRSSLGGKVLTALAFGVFFQVAVCGLGLFLLIIGLAMIYFLGILGAKLGMVPIGFGSMLLWSIIPRRDHFEPPGPLLREEDEPELFAAIDEIARATGQKKPDLVYAVPQVNAFVTHRGGFLGIGAKRVMGIGWPLLQNLTVNEFKAVLAHEFGHFHGGDLRRGPVIYRMREAMGRVIMSMEGHGRLQKPFLWYGNRFMAMTQIISRRQEYNADALAAKTVGAQPLINGLRKVGATAQAFDIYWEQEISSLLSAGFRPRFAQGFARFLACDRVVEIMAGSTEMAHVDTDAHPFDSHPATAYRIKNLNRLRQPAEPDESPTAFSLLRNPEQMETHFLDCFSDTGFADYPMIEWDEVGARYYLGSYKAQLEREAEGLRGLRLWDAHRHINHPRQLMEALELDEEEYTRDEMARTVAWYFQCGLCVALGDRGYKLVTQPGEPITLCQGKTTVRPDVLMQQILNGEMNPEQWRHGLKRLGLTDFRLLDHAEWEGFDNEVQRRRLTTRKPPTSALLSSDKRALFAIPGILCILIGLFVGLFAGLIPMSIWILGGILLFVLPDIWAGRRANGRHGVLTLEDGVLTFASKTSTSLPLNEIEKLWVYAEPHLDKHGEHLGWLWRLRICAAGKTIRMEHYRSNATRGNLMDTLILEMNRGNEAWMKARLEAGDTIGGKGWRVSKQGLGAADGPLVPWAELARPSWDHATLFFQRQGRLLPFLMLDARSVNARGLVRIAWDLCGYEETIGLGRYRESAPVRIGMTFLVGLVVGLLVGLIFLITLWDGKPFWPLLPVFSACAAWCWVEMRTRLFLFEGGLLRRRPLGTHAIVFSDLQALVYDMQLIQGMQFDVVKLITGKGSTTVVTNPKDHDFAKNLVRKAGYAVTRKMYEELKENGRVRWRRNLYFTDKGLWFEKGKGEMWPYEEVVHEEGRVYLASQPGTRVQFKLEDRNYLPGLSLLEIMIDEMDESPGDYPSRRRLPVSID